MTGINWEFEDSQEELELDDTRSLFQGFFGKPDQSEPPLPAKNGKGQRFLKKKKNPSVSHYRLQAFLVNTDPGELNRIDPSWRDQLNSGS